MPLTDVRVLDLSRLLPGGQCTLMLADMGADVIKVEEPMRGDYIRLASPFDEHGVSPLHLCYNRNKRSLALDLKNQDGVSVLLDLVKNTDVLVDSFRPGVMERLGIGYQRLKKENPTLVHCSITGYGQDGPLARAPGHDLNFQAMGGVVELTGAAGGPPYVPGVLIGDVGAGMWAAFAILAALRLSERTGVGQFIDISMLDAVMSFLSIHGQTYLSTGQSPGREEMRHNGRRPCYRLYPTKDGRMLSVACSEPKFWVNLCKLIGHEDFYDDYGARGERRLEVIQTLNNTFQSKTLEEWIAHFDGADVCVSPALNMHESFGHTQVQSSGLVRDYQHPLKGTYPGTRPAPKFSNLPIRDSLPPPRLGEHSVEILMEHGFQDEEIESLLASGASHRGADPAGETISE
ncbi:MAG: CaiB/BaiF CoA-transferase family protein [Nitrospinae bacterium]|nr:CaiB/BaiF CoA-transferase family protein [Nitrospinota bacterium]